MDLETPHKHSIYNRVEVESSASCGCFHCCEVFPAGKVDSWITEGGGKAETAECPKCGIDAVIGDASGLPVTDSIFLNKMSKRWFC